MIPRLSKLTVVIYSTLCDMTSSINILCLFFTTLLPIDHTSNLRISNQDLRNVFCAKIQLASHLFRHENKNNKNMSPFYQYLFNLSQTKSSHDIEGADHPMSRMCVARYLRQ